jgi:hypothetical protein
MSGTKSRSWREVYIELSNKIEGTTLPKYHYSNKDYSGGKESMSIYCPIRFLDLVIHMTIWWIALAFS